ncbi:hypothetical protein EDD35_7329 [Amycolatopsis thermoflava]|uniref:Uncharacterized protein n=1 Tax=Amycolatopsis thermoflava TaxID=84480 RepID=A0A3N2H7J6_9PSEU|nr:hypothetical protein [Amycolatopsis thermoflava]ROS44873.1 hypothetical protein EDD35_7329 [Amycolatopsis thermoflava]
MRVRHGVRAVMLDDDDRILLCRMRIAPPGTAVWITPGVVGDRVVAGQLRRRGRFPTPHCGGRPPPSTKPVSSSSSLRSASSGDSPSSTPP